MTDANLHKIMQLNYNISHSYPVYLDIHVESYPLKEANAKDYVCPSLSALKESAPLYYYLFYNYFSKVGILAFLLHLLLV